LQKQLALLEVSPNNTSASGDVLKGRESRIEELEKELTSLREHHAKDKDEAVALVKSRDARIKELQDMLAASSNRNFTTESAPKNNSKGSSEENKACVSKSSTLANQFQSSPQHTPPVTVSTGSNDYHQVQYSVLTFTSSRSTVETGSRA